MDYEEGAFYERKYFNHLLFLFRENPRDCRNDRKTDRRNPKPDLSEAALPCGSLLPVTERADKYDIVFAGSPNWCGTIAPPLTAWLKENNMAGKILLPFFSHCGGEDKGMEQAVRDLCPEAKIGSSLYVLENRRENLQDMVQAWLEQNFPENHS